MWIVPSHGRPDWCMRLADSFGPEDLKQPVAVVLCDRDPKVDEYLKRSWPETWAIRVAVGEYTYCGEKMNWALQKYPNAKFYGHLCDDVWIETKNMLPQLAEAAGDWRMSYPSDGIYDDQEPTGLICFPCSGGKLIRTIGWWAHPMLKHNCLDSVLTDIGRSLGIAVNMRHLKLGMVHPVNRKAEWDDTYQRVEQINLEAGDIYHKVWDMKPARKEVLDRIKAAMEADGVSP